MATKVTQPIGGFLDVNNPEFLNAYQGWKISEANPQGQLTGGTLYEVRADGVYDIGPVDFNKPNQQIRGFSKETGIQPTPNWSGGSTSEKFKYFTTPEKEAAKTATSNFGMGQGAVNSDQYTGKTYGQTSGGKTLYELKDGNVTSVAPPESVKITGDVVADTPQAIKDFDISNLETKPIKQISNGINTYIVPDDYNSSGYMEHMISIQGPKGEETPKDFYKFPPGESLDKYPVSNSYGFTFKSGLTTEQQKGIIRMLDAKRGKQPLPGGPNIYPESPQLALNETDAKNLAFAIGDSDWKKYSNKTPKQIFPKKLELLNQPPLPTGPPAGRAPVVPVGPDGIQNIPSGAGKKLSPDEYYNARTSYGVSPKNFDDFFIKSGKDIYIKQGITVPQTPGTTPTTPTSKPEPDGIKWHPGLSETQKQGIINLVQNKPRDQWDAKDVANYNFATGSKEEVITPPTAGTGTQPTTGGKTTQKPGDQILGENVNTGMGEAHFRGDGALIKFAEDPDGPGPQSTATIWYVDPLTKNLYPILSPEAFNNFFNETLDEVVARGGIQTVPLTSINQGGILSGFTLLKDNQGIGSGNERAKPEATVDTSKLQTRYGKPRDEELERKALKQIDGLLTMLKNDPNSGVNGALIDEISQNTDVMASYINAFAYGEYNPNDIYRDIRRRQLVQNGREDMKTVKVIDEATIASQYYNTVPASSIRNNADLLPPEYIGDIDTGLLDNSIFNLPKEVYEVLVPPFDWRSPAGQAELDKIKSAYHDVLIKQLEATTEQERIIANQDYNKLKDDIGRYYNITLSDNASQAWSQISSLGEQLSGRGLGSSGLTEEAQQRYLADRRKADERLRTEQLSKEEVARRNYYLQSASPEEVAKLSAEEKTKYGLTPSTEASSFFTTGNLKAKYPNLSDQEIENYRSSIIDPTTGTYRSKLFQTLQQNRLGVQQDKLSYQLGGVTTDTGTGDIMTASGVLGKKALEEEERYRPFDKTPSLPTTLKPTTNINL